MELIFWQPMLSILQSALLRSLAAKGHAVTIVAEWELLPDRKELGWSVPDFGPARVVVNPDDSQIDELIRCASREAVHIVHGYRGYRIGRMALQKCIARSSRVGLMSESADPRGLKGAARKYLYTADRFAWGRRLGFVLGMGDMGVRWYRQTGYTRVFPFGYFLDVPAIEWQAQAEKQNEVLITYIGRYIPCKGLDLLLQALAQLKEPDWELTLIGDGICRNALMQLTADLGLGAQVRFLPSMPRALAMERLAASDLFVLPSRQDGWGAVVNEALTYGVPVICSNRCGAQDLLSESWRGDVFESGSVDQLARLLSKWIARGKRTEDQVRRLRAWSCRSIEGSVAADYLLAIFEHLYGHAVLPLPPWNSPHGRE